MSGKRKSRAEKEKARKERKKHKGMREDWYYKRGDIYLADLNPFTGSEQGGIRPVVVISNNAGNFFSDILNVIPITSELKKRNLPTHYVLKHKSRLDKKSMVVAEQHRNISKSRVIRYLGKVDPDDMKGIENAIRVECGFDELTPLPVCEEFP